MKNEATEIAAVKNFREKMLLCLKMIALKRIWKISFWKCTPLSNYLRRHFAQWTSFIYMNKFFSSLFPHKYRGTCPYYFRQQTHLALDFSDCDEKLHMLQALPQDATSFTTHIADPIPAKKVA